MTAHVDDGSECVRKLTLSDCKTVDDIGEWRKQEDAAEEWRFKCNFPGRAIERPTWLGGIHRNAVDSDKKAD